MPSIQLHPDPGTTMRRTGCSTLATAGPTPAAEYNLGARGALGGGRAKSPADASPGTCQRLQPTIQRLDALGAGFKPTTPVREGVPTGSSNVSGARFTDVSAKQHDPSFREPKSAFPTPVSLRELEARSVLLNLKTESYLGLDQVGTRMWALFTTVRPSRLRTTPS